ncbi:hypothetical protein, partial [Mesorhizobium japonicum]
MYLINGQLHTECSLDSALHQLQRELPRRLQLPLQTSTLLATAKAFAERLQQEKTELPLAPGQREALIDFCQPAALQAKLDRELGLRPES